MCLTTRFRQIPIWAWLLWAIVCLVFIATSVVKYDGDVRSPSGLSGVVAHDFQSSLPILWRPVHRSCKWLRNEFRQRLHRARQRVHRRAALVKHLAQLVLKGALTMATVVDLLTRSQLRRHLGALSVLYAPLDTLQVREIINRHCPTAAQVDHGAGTAVMILNRLVAPRPLSDRGLAGPNGVNLPTGCTGGKAQRRPFGAHVFQPGRLLPRNG